jgi:2,3-bisphosphoglycerate-dependent phosphoglycerate mutase
MQLYYIRHAQSTNNALYVSSNDYSRRSSDPGLTPTGIQQAECLAHYLSERNGGSAPDGGDIQNRAGFGLTHIYTSLMLRAVATGRRLAEALGLPLVAWTDLHEGGGVYKDDPESGEQVGLPGAPRSFFEAHYPNLLLPDELDEEGWWKRPFETRPERRARAGRVLDELLRRHGDQPHRVGIISHGGFYHHLMAVLLNMQGGSAPLPAEAVQSLNADNVFLGPQLAVWFELNNVAITRIDFLPGEARVMYLNRLDFLPGELIT